MEMEFNLERPVNIQDSVHICTKLKTRLTNPRSQLQLGKYLVSTTHIEAIIQNYSKDKHLLCASYLNNADKMNFKAIDMLSQERVIKLLNDTPESQGTAQYLRLCRMIIKIFLIKETKIEERISWMWYTTFFIRLWRHWLIDNGYSLQKHFITHNASSCIKLNAHGLLLLLEKCRMNGSKSFLPWLYSSQPCEKMFRQTRSMTSTYSTVVNYSLYEMIKKVHRIQMLDEISCDLCNTFNFPKEKHGRLGMTIESSVDRDNPQLIDDPISNIDDLPTANQVLQIMEKSKFEAMEDAKKMGMCLKSSELCLDKSFLPGLSEPIEESDDDDDDSEKEVDDTSGESDEDQAEDQEIRNDLASLAPYDSLDLKDYQTTKPNEGVNFTFIELTLNNNKKVTVRKSSLCWLFSEKTGRLSSDRLLRVRGMSSKEKMEKDKIKNKGKKIASKLNTNRKAKTVQYDDSDTTVTDYSSGSESEEVKSEDDYEKMTLKKSDWIKLLPKENLNIGDFILVNFKSVGRRVAISYKYVASILKIIDDSEIEVNCLKSADSTNTAFTYIEDDISVVETDAVLGKLPEPKIIKDGRILKTVFCGPVDVFEKI